MLNIVKMLLYRLALSNFDMKSPVAFFFLEVQFFGSKLLARLTLYVLSFKKLICFIFRATEKTKISQGQHDMPV